MFLSFRKKRPKRKTLKVTPLKLQEPRVFHFYDDMQHNFEGVTMSEDGSSVEHMMCAGNIACHKVQGKDADSYTPRQAHALLNRYLSNMSNPSMRAILALMHENLQSSRTSSDLFMNPESGMTDKEVYPLCDPALKNTVVGFDMDLTLHQFGHFLNIPTKRLTALMSKMTKSRITYTDVGEMYFGGKARLAKFRAMFQNLAKTIGMRNVYLITSNPSSRIPEIIPDLYRKLFNVHFLKENVKMTDMLNLSKYEIIKEIMK